jgi:hypothetical protein
MATEFQLKGSERFMTKGPLDAIDDQIRRLDEQIARVRQLLPARTENMVSHDSSETRAPPTKAEVAAGILGVFCVASFVAAFIFEARKFNLSGVPFNHFALNEGERYFYVPRGGGPIEDRQQKLISLSQYHAWEVNSAIAFLFGLLGVIFGFVATGTVLLTRFKLGPGQRLPIEGSGSRSILTENKF